MTIKLQIPKEIMTMPSKTEKIIIKQMYLSKSPSPYPFQTHAHQFKFSCTIKEQHKRNVGQNSTMPREKERERREEGEGWKGLFFPQKQAAEKQVESWIRLKR